MKKNMQTQLRNWLERKLNERSRGAKAQLANYIGVDKTAITRMLTPPKTQGFRIITGDELIEMAKFFGELPPGLSAEEVHAERNEIIELYEQATPEQQHIILSLLKSFTPPKKKK